MTFYWLLTVLHINEITFSNNMKKTILQFCLQNKGLYLLII